VRNSDALELELQTAVSCHVGAANITQDLRKSNQRSQPLNHLSSPKKKKNFFFKSGFLFIVLAVLELTLYTRLASNLVEIHLPLPPKCWD
jgi:hypothetical protein